jgi:FkbM family methyltransferase
MEVMNVVERLAKPEYLLQPRRLLRRLLGRSAAAGRDGMYVLPLPWSLDLQVRQLDAIGQGVDRLGVHDLVVTEAIWRLIRPGDTVIDVGANVGYMSLAMMARLGRSGRVFAFEPQPGVFDELSTNIAAARERLPGLEVIVRAEALSDSVGTAGLLLPAGSKDNRGLAHIGAVSEGVPVPLRRLDEFASELGPDVALIKIDVEGHEPAVLRGAGALIERGVVRHVIIEEHGRYPTEASSLLERSGYTIFSLDRSLLRVRLGDPARPQRTWWQAPSLLATRTPSDVAKLFGPIGWRALGS